MNPARTLPHHARCRRRRRRLARHCVLRFAYLSGHVGNITRAQWTAWSTGATSQDVADFRTFLTGNSRNAP